MLFGRVDYALALEFRRSLDETAPTRSLLVLSRSCALLICRRALPA